MASAYEDAREFCKQLARQRRGAGLFKTLLLRRIGSSLVAGLSTAEKLLERAPSEDLFAEEDEDAPVNQAAEGEADIEIERLPAHEFLRRAIDSMRAVGNADPKLLAVIRYLREERWAERGCILFSQYFDTVWWMANQIADTFPAVPVGVYAGLGNTFLLQGSDAQRAERTEIQTMVKQREAEDPGCD